MPKSSSVYPMPGTKSTIGRIFLRVTRFFFGVGGRIAPGFTSRVAMKVFLKPPKPARPAWEEKILSAARRFDLQVGDHRIAMWVWGDLQEKPVLLVHGWGGRGSQLGAFVEPLRQAGYSVVTFDAPGHGDSSGKYSAFPLIEETLRAVAENVGPLAAVIAHSAGAAVAQAALIRGLETEKLIFLAPGVDPLHFTRIFGEMLGVGERVLQRMRQRIETRYQVSLLDYQALRRAGSQLTPLLIAHDRGDFDTPFEGGRELAEQWPAARFLPTEGLGHRRILREEAVITSSLQFLRCGHPISDCAALAGVPGNLGPTLALAS